MLDFRCVSFEATQRKVITFFFFFLFRKVITFLAPLLTLALISGFAMLPLSLGAGCDLPLSNLSCICHYTRRHANRLQLQHPLSSGPSLMRAMDSMLLCGTACPTQDSWCVFFQLQDWRAEIGVMPVALCAKHVAKTPLGPRKTV